MAVVAALMDKARAKAGITSDNALAGALNRSRQVVSQWRIGDAYPDEELIVRMAEMAKEDPAEWLVAIKAVRTEGAAGKVWSQLAKKLAASAIAILLMAGFSIGNPEKASKFNSLRGGNTHSLYIM